MATYSVVVEVTKTYLVEVEADDEEEARSMAESDVQYAGVPFGPDDVESLSVELVDDEAS